MQEHPNPNPLMTIPQLLAKHLREVHFGGNWSTSCLREQLQGLNLEQVLHSAPGFHSIATLTVHCTYYVRVLRDVLQTGELKAKDEFSFQLPELDTQAQWDEFLNKIWRHAEEAATLLEDLPEERLKDFFTDEKYGLWHRNIMGIIEHLHYHLGQIALQKKLIMSKAPLSSQLPPA